MKPWAALRPRSIASSARKHNMDERWQKIERIFLEARELKQNERAAFLAQVCAGDEDLRREVESLLVQKDQHDSFLESPAIEMAAGSLGKDGAFSGVRNPELESGAMIAHYRVTGKIGAGGMGEVYRARDTKLQRDVALKILPETMARDAERMARFEREAQVLASLNNPNIAVIHGLEESNGIRALVMELVEGETLAERISVAAVSPPPGGFPKRKAAREDTGTTTVDRRSPMTTDEALPIARQIAEALEYAHDRGVIHRDLKPANVKITPEGTVKVLDFGLAKVMSPQDSSATMDTLNSPTLTTLATEPGMILGTAAYMSPEQAKGQRVDRRCDIWAFGCVLYEMLAGRKPFAGETISDVLAAVLTKEPDWTAFPDTTPEGIRRLIHRCLVKNSKQRLRDIGDARITIEETLSGTGDLAGNSRFVETRPRRGDHSIDNSESDQALVEQHPEVAGADTQPIAGKKGSRYWLVPAALVLAVAGVLIYRWAGTSNPPTHRTLTRLTFDNGLQVGATFSPDGRYFAYASDRDGKFDIWMQQVNGAGSPVQVTHGPGNNWEPEWSPDGKYIAYRSEGQGAGIFIVPVLGGAGLQRKIASFGHHPHWSPDGSRLIFQSHPVGLGSRIFLVSVADGSEAREILQSVTKGGYVVSAAWHPEGKRVSLYGWGLSPMPTFWTGPVDSDEPAIETRVAPELLGLIEAEAGHGFSTWGDFDYVFSWDPTGRIIYFERSFRGARNIWRMPVDRTTLQATGLERLTTGTELASDFALSPDGKKMLFTSKSEAVRDWVFPLNSSTGRIESEGQPVTSSGMEAWQGDLSSDGAKLAFDCKRAGQYGLCEKDLSTGSENTLSFDDPYIRSGPHWSPDGTHLAYVRAKASTGEFQVVTWDSKTRSEHIVTELRRTWMLFFDWSPDGNWLLVSEGNPFGGQMELWRFRAEGVHRPNDARVVASGPGFDIYQENFSPDGRWIVFEGVKGSAKGSESAIYVVPSGGGSWTQITDGKQWQDKPRWSADGRTIFFISDQNGFLNVFSVPFDPIKGKAAGAISQVTDFKSADLEIPNMFQGLGFSLANGKAMLTISQSSGGIWLLDNLNP
jgi:serine/threonine protein kinase/Tol biopolymer transport system component